ncbi:hypothetical protein FRB94_010171 [Tulasnella sp. JGI-2019a]|nr:hypothetical protein FRB94_010171 [Tulasnella sp. JGI-2019a]KAG9035571.1 hypothetical protein FRB95_011115 [Tulasnella sp. JGI-2019a]
MMPFDHSRIFPTPDLATLDMRFHSFRKSWRRSLRDHQAVSSRTLLYAACDRQRVTYFEQMREGESLYLRHVVIHLAASSRISYLQSQWRIDNQRGHAEEAGSTANRINA